MTMLRATHAHSLFFIRTYDAALERQFPVMCMEDNPCDCHRYYDIGVRMLKRLGLKNMNSMQPYKPRVEIHKKYKSHADYWAAAEGETINQD